MPAHRGQGQPPKYLAINPDSGRVYVSSVKENAGIFIIREISSELFCLEEFSSKCLLEYIYPINYSNRYEVFCNGGAFGNGATENTSLLKLKYNPKTKLYSLKFDTGNSLVYNEDDLLIYASNDLIHNTKVNFKMENVD